MKFGSVIYNDKLDEQMMKVVIKELFAKIKKVLIKAGLELTYKVLQLWYVLQKPEVPYPIKATIVGALMYFILPVDSIPDFLPGGFVDDTAAIAFALSMATLYVDEEVNEKARKKLIEFLAQVVL
jgi:uncharacterized membrane protein YkvA (DUF1232 family)